MHPEFSQESPVAVPLIDSLHALCGISRTHRWLRASECQATRAHPTARVACPWWSRPLSSASESREELRELTHTDCVYLYAQAIISGVEAAIGTASDEQ